MKKFRVVFVLFLLLLLYQLKMILAGQLLGKTQTLIGFRIPIENIILFISLFILILIFSWQEMKDAPDKKNSPLRIWMGGFLSFFISLTLFVVILNPHARFPWKFFPYAYSIIHSEKLKLYEKLDESPSIIVLGSSRAFTMPADYIEEISDYRAFNMSVTNATPLDLYALEQYVVDHNQEKPLIFVVEILGRGLVNKSNEQDNMPLELLPYLPVIDTKSIIAATFEDVFSLPSFSDALFISMGFEFESEVIDHFLPDGTAVFKKGKNPQNIKQESLVIYDVNYSCKSVGDELYKDGMADIEKMIHLSEIYKFSMVFYRSPLNGEFFNSLDAVRLNNLNHCIFLVNDYFNGLAEEHGNIFYLDLTQFQSINQLGFEGFVDAHHPGREAAKMIVDALHPLILDGLDWVSNNP